MPNSTPRPATDDEVAGTLAFDLRYEGRRRVRDADDAMARITAARLVKLLRASGYEVSKTAPALAPGTTEHVAKGASGATRPKP